MNKLFFLVSFFEKENKYISSKDMTDPDILEDYIIKYQTYLDNSDLKDDPDLQSFLSEMCSYLEKARQKSKEIIKEETQSRPLTLSERVTKMKARQYRNVLAPKACNNPVINRWVNLAKITYVVKKRELGDLYNRIGIRTDRNADAINESWIEGKHYLVRK